MVMMLLYAVLYSAADRSLRGKSTGLMLINQPFE